MNQMITGSIMLMPLAIYKTYCIINEPCELRKKIIIFGDVSFYNIDLYENNKLVEQVIKYGEFIFYPNLTNDQTDYLVCDHDDYKKIDHTKPRDSYNKTITIANSLDMEVYNEIEKLLLKGKFEIKLLFHFDQESKQAHGFKINKKHTALEWHFDKHKIDKIDEVIFIQDVTAQSIS